MIRVVIDTNVLVSALLTSGGLPEAVINLAISGAVQWCASESVLAEYEDVVKRPRLAIDAGKAPKQWPESGQLSQSSHRQCASQRRATLTIIISSKCARPRMHIISLQEIFVISLRFGKKLES